MYPSTNIELLPIIYFIHANYYKDLPLLDDMGLQYLCCGPSFNFSNRILRSVGLSQPQAIFPDFVNSIYSL